MEAPAGDAGDSGGAVEPPLHPLAAQRSGRSSPSRSGSSSGPMRGQSSTRMRALHYAAAEAREQEVRATPRRIAWLPPLRHAH
jgi:hypothetical protein